MSFVVRIIKKNYVRFYNYRFKVKITSLIKNGLKLGKNVTIMPTAYIDDEHPYLISIGDNCSISHGVYIFTHDATPLKFTEGYQVVDKVDIKENCFIGTGAIILPGVIMGPNVSVAAGSVVTKNIPPNSCVAGSPARVYGKFDELINRHKENIENSLKFDYKELVCPVDVETINKIKKGLQSQSVYEKTVERLSDFEIT